MSDLTLNAKVWWVPASLMIIAVMFQSMPYFVTGVMTAFLAMYISLIIWAVKKWKEETDGKR